MAARKWKRLDTYCDWHNYDRLNGIDLEDGEQLDIKWPDGTVTTNRISLRRYAIEGRDMGNRYDHPQREAFIEVEVAGLRVPVSLREHKSKLMLARASG